MESKVKTLVIDLETTIKCPVGNHSANPMWTGNKIIAAGYKDVDADDVTIEYDASGVATEALLVTCSSADMVVGHNVKFDLLYIYRNAKVPLPRIWDTQLAAYLLSGQRQLYASLDQLTAEYVGEHALKDDKMKEYWKAGVCTSEIPKSELCDYLWHDVDNTAQIFRKQFDEAK
jgi:DNA polymerase I-like protein with 3'-5' exonuclease and polymerase domains